MPVESQAAANRAWSRCFGVSLVLHGLLLLAICFHPRAVLLRPRFVARGEGGKSAATMTSLYFPVKQAQLLTARPSSALILPAAQRKQLSKPRTLKRHNLIEAADKDSREQGSDEGTSVDGELSGDIVRPALPATFSEPRIAFADVPDGLQGDVVVEITIDAQGNVVSERLLQGLAPTIDVRVMAAVREWHFHPATRNGVAIPSKYDMHYHFPS